MTPPALTPWRILRDIDAEESARSAREAARKFSAADALRRATRGNTLTDTLGNTLTDTRPAVPPVTPGPQPHRFAGAL